MESEARKIMEQFGDSAGRTASDTSYKQYVREKWAPLLKGIPALGQLQEHNRDAFAMMLEEQGKFLAGQSVIRLDEDTRSGNVGYFTKFVFPLLRRAFPNLISPECVSVQPVTSPVGAIFYYENVYQTSKGQTTAGNKFPQDFDKDYTSEQIQGEILQTGDGTNFGGGGTAFSANLAFNPVRPLNPDRGYKLEIKEVNPTTGVVVQVATDDGNGAFTFAPTGVNAAGVINYSNGAVNGFKFQNIPATSNQIKAYYWYDGESSTKIAQTGFDIKKATFEVETHRLKMTWSSESSEDYRALHGGDAETELVSNAAHEFALEIDRRIIDALFKSSTGTTGTFDRLPPAGINELDHLRAIITVLSTISHTIHQKTLRAPANWMITSPFVAALLDQFTTHGDYRAVNTSGGESPYGPADMPRPLTQHGQFGIYRMGTMANKWMTYVDPFFTRDFILMGLKGASYLEAGAVFAPFLPLQVTPTFLDPADQQFKKGLRTRYAFKIVRPEYYGQIRVLNL